MIHLLHGIHTPYGDPKVKALIPYLTPLGNVVYPDYGYIMAIETKRMNPPLVGMLLPYIESGDWIVAHSNGCAIAYDLIGRLPPEITNIGLVLIDGALRRDIVLPPCVRACHIYFNAGDQITEVAALAELLPFSLVDPNWGEMGHCGPTADVAQDPRVLVVDCAHTSGEMNDEGHSEIFVSPEIESWGPYIAKQMVARHG